jgi:AraC-like DNA-binding protein
MKAFTRTGAQSAFYISLAGTSYCDSSYLIERKNSPNAVIEYVVDGEGEVHCNGKIFRVKNDMIYFLPAHADQRYFADAENPFIKIFMDLRGELVETLTEAYDLTGKYVFEGTGLKASFERIQTLLHSDKSDDEIQCAMQGIFVEILSALSRTQTEAHHSDEALTIKKYLDSNTDKIVSAKELSAIVFRSPDYCQKLFLREFGTTPYEYQLKNKMHIAKTLLSNTTMTVGEISDSLGYSDQHHFSNLFKSRCGMSPLAWRKK